MNTHTPNTHAAHAPRIRRRTALAGTLALAGALTLAGCSDSSSADESASGPKLKVSGAYMPQPLMADMAAGFLTIRNTGDQDDKLTKVTSDIAGKVELHKTVDQRMRQVKSLPVPADGELTLSRGGSHLMFLDLKHKPAKGDTVSVKLHFATHDPITVSVPVKATNHNPDHGGHGKSGHDGHDKAGHGGHGK